MQETYSSYRKLYKQNFTMPLGPLAQYVGNVPIDFGHIITFVALYFLMAILYGAVLGDTTIFGFGKPLWSAVMAFPCAYWLLRRDTVGQPLNVFLMHLIQFPFTKHWSVAFITFPKPNKALRLDGKIPFRAVLTKDQETQFMSLPIEGTAEMIEGMHLKTSGATRVEINPVTKKVAIKVGEYDKIQPVVQEVHRLRKTVIDVGRGDLRFMHRNGKLKAVFEPNHKKIERE